MQEDIVNNLPYIVCLSTYHQGVLFGKTSDRRCGGFTDYEWEDYYKENEGIEFATQRKKNSHRGDTFIDEMAKKYNRKIVETAYSVITSRFPKRIHAVSIDGFQLKVFFVILAYSIIKYI